MLKRRRAARRTSSILTRGSCKLYVVSFIAPRRRFTTRVPKKQFGGAGQRALQAAPGALLSRDRRAAPAVPPRTRRHEPVVDHFCGLLHG